MYKRSFLAVTVLLCLFSLSLHAQQVFKTTPTSVIPYLEYVPQDYASNSNKYPIVIFLHGIGERGPNTTDITQLSTSVWNVAKNGPPKLVKYGQQFPFILISPQLKNNYGTWPTSYVLEVINYVKTYLRVDERQIHITGLSLGGGGTWTMAEYYPELFATASPMCGGYNAPSKACAIAAENLPVWAFHGDADTTVPYSKTVNMVNAINSCTPTPNPLAKVTIYPGVNHNCWDRSYTADNTYHNPNVYQWMLSHANTINKGNKIPVANAGSDKSTTSKSLTITATATDGDGTIASYVWTQFSGPACTMSNTTSASLALSNLVNGTYVFRVIAKDNAGAQDSDYIKVTVSTTTLAANAGVDVTKTLPTTSATLAGSGTGTISSYKWTYVSGPKTPTLTNASTASVTVSNMTTAGDYVMQLEVVDANGAVAKDQAKITIKNSTTNISPVANAGADKTIYLPTSSITIAGTGTDADGAIKTYRWTQVSGPKAATMTNTTTSSVTASDMTVTGFYVFKLTVTDDAGAIAEDKMGVTVKSQVTSASYGTAIIEDDPAAELTDAGNPYWADKQVLVYSDNGSLVHAGKWDASSYESTIARGGMFIYKVNAGNTNLYTKKIAVVQ